MNESQETAEAQLRQKGYAPEAGRQYYKVCHPSRDAFISAMADKGKTAVRAGDADCEKWFNKGQSKVVMRYIMSPNGYVVTDVSYYFLTADSQQVIADLSKKFGKPARNFSNGTEWTADSANPFRLARLQYSKSNDSDTVSLESGTEFKDAIAKKTSADLVKKTGRSSPEL